MYKTFFGLKRDPFSVAADPRFIYMSPQHRQAAQHLLFGLQSGAGFILLTGEVGAGKTMVCRAFLRMLPPNADVVNVVNPRVSFHMLLLRVCEDLRIELTGESPDLIDAIHGHLLLARAQGRRTLIVVDEAQALSHEVLELLRLLTNLDSTGRKLQIFLIGQPELRDTLRLPALKPVSQRIVARFHLDALPESETARYIEHRLIKAGLTGPLPFDAQSIRAVHRASAGVPRRINVLCDRAMLTAKGLQTRQINAQMIEHIIPEVFDGAIAAVRPGSTDVATPTAEKLAEALTEESDSGSAAELPVEIAALETAVAKSQGGRRQQRWWTALAIVGIASVAYIAFQAVILEVKSSTSTEGSSPSTTISAMLVQAAQAVAATHLRSTEPSSDNPASGAGSTPSSEPSLSSMDAVLRVATLNEFIAWRELARLWGVALPPGDPCIEAIPLGLRCHRTRGGLESIRRLDRPSILSLRHDDGRTAFVLLTGLGNGTARLRSDKQEYTVPLRQLAGRWQGAFATLWSAPPQIRGGDTAEDGDMAGWLRQRFTVIDGTTELVDTATAINKRVAAFQVANGLQPDGIAGPVTLMALNRLSKVREPRLKVER